MPKNRFPEWVKSLPTASSPDARWGLGGIWVGIILFVPPLAIFFFDKGGILMPPSWVWIVAGSIVAVAWVFVFVVGVTMFWRWWKGKDRQSQAILTSLDRQIIREVVKATIGEIRQERNGKQSGTRKHKSGHSVSRL